MKLTMLLLTVFCLHVSAHTYSQEKISLKLKAVELKKVLQAIEKSSDYRFLFDEVLVKGKPKVSVDVENADINQVLALVLSNTGIGYQILNTNLVVLKESGTQQELKDITVSGKVTSSTGEPLAGVSVTLKNSSVGTTTNAEGSYSLTVPDDAILVFTSIGYTSVEEKVSGRSAINIVMQPATQSMNEVVVVGCLLYTSPSPRD